MPSRPSSCPSWCRVTSLSSATTARRLDGIAKQLLLELLRRAQQALAHQAAALAQRRGHLIADRLGAADPALLPALRQAVGGGHQLHQAHVLRRQPDLLD